MSNTKALIVEAVERYTAAKTVMAEAVKTGTSDQHQSVCVALAIAAEEGVIGAIRGACLVRAVDPCGIIVGDTVYLAADYGESDLDRSPSDAPMSWRLHTMPLSALVNLDALPAPVIAGTNGKATAPAKRGQKNRAS